MALTPEPRPRKIRRRNAITVLDQHQLPMFRQSVDSFESASLLQSLEDQQQQQLAVASGNGFSSSGMEAVAGAAMPAPLHFHRQSSPAKRKVPKARLKSSSPTFKHRLKAEEGNISQIRLHQDLTSHMQSTKNNEILPEAILKSYRDQYQSSVVAAAAAAATTAAPSPCQALVLYTPPEKIIHEALNRSRQREAKLEQLQPPVENGKSSATTNSRSEASMETDT